MATGSVKGVLLPGVIIAAGFVGIFTLSGHLEKIRPVMPDSYQDSDLSMNGSKLKGFALGFEPLIADWYWMRSLQYIGGKLVNNADVNLDDLRELNPRLLYPYLDNATDLDPHFLVAYSYGAVVLPAIDPAKAIAIAEKGITNNPGEWRLYQHLGYIYWKLKQYDKAAATYDRGAEIDGAPPFMKIMSAAMKTEGGSRSTARQIFIQMRDGTDDPMVRLTAVRRLNAIDSLDERDAIDRVLDDHKTRTGRCAANLSEIIPLLMQVRLPDGNEFQVDKSNRLVDPTDAPYILDRENCRVKLDVEHTGLAVN